jgi:hypothetical protein
MSKGVEPILIAKQAIIILPRTRSTIAKGVPMVVKIKYSEPKLNQQSGSIVKRLFKDWNRGIHSVN